MEKQNYVWAVIYKWTNKINGKSYIGQTTREKLRYREHLYDRRVNKYFHNAIDKYGIENFEYSVLFKVHCPKEFAKEILDYNEKKYIKEYRTFGEGYNLTDGGDGSTHTPFSEEHKRKISIASLGHPYRGCGKGNFHFTEEQRKYLSEKAKGRKNEHSYRPVIMYDLNENPIREFKSITEARHFIDGDKLKNGSGHIGDVCSGKRKQCCGYKWRYKE